MGGGSSYEDSIPRSDSGCTGLGEGRRATRSTRLLAELMIDLDLDSDAGFSGVFSSSGDFDFGGDSDDSSPRSDSGCTGLGDGRRATRSTMRPAELMIDLDSSMMDCLDGINKGFF